MHETGAPGRTIVSVFEADLGPALHQERQQQQQESNPAECDALPPAAAAALQQALRRELINYCSSAGAPSRVLMLTVMLMPC